MATFTLFQAEELEHTSGHSSLLAFAPPDGWESYQTRNVPTSGGVISLTAGQDYRLVMPSTYVNKRIQVQGGRNVVVIGGEININTDWGGTGDDNNGIWFSNQTGTIHVEGLLIHGAFLNDGIKTFAGDAIQQYVNVRVDELHGSGAGYHCDALQCVSGFTKLRIDKFTGYSQFQLLMFKSDGNASHRWRETDIRRLNGGPYPGVDSTGRLLNFISGVDSSLGLPWIEGPIWLEGVYLQSVTTSITSSLSPAAWFTVSGSPGSQTATPNPNGWQTTNPGLHLNGAIVQGLPVGGDYVPASVVGVGYRSPGYSSLLVTKVAPLGQMVEAETAQPVSFNIASQIVLIGQPAEPEIAQPVSLDGGPLTVVIGQVGEAEQAFAFQAAPPGPIGNPPGRSIKMFPRRRSAHGGHSLRSGGR